MSEWMNRWLLKLNVGKCKVVSNGKVVNMNNSYSLGGAVLEKTDNIKDLGIIFDCKLKFDLHINEKINKAYSMLSIIKRNFIHLTADSFIILYKAMVRSHLEYAVSVWAPYRMEHIRKLE
jgi:hypothetical protein